VVVDEPRGLYYGGEVAAPVFKRIAEQVLRVKSVVPDVPQYSPRYAVTPEKPKTKPLRRPPPDDFKVVDASLNSTKEASDSFEPGSIVVPDLTGQPLLKAADATDRLGLVPLPDGSGKVISQNPPPGAHVRPGSAIQLKLSAR
jgi:hypothetical protein